jgi:hypothetical protein
MENMSHSGHTLVKGLLLLSVLAVNFCAIAQSPPTCTKNGAVGCDPTLPVNTVTSAPPDLYVLSTGGVVDVYDVVAHDITYFYNFRAVSNGNDYINSTSAGPSYSINLTDVPALAATTPPGWSSYNYGALALSENQISPYLFVLQLGVFAVDLGQAPGKQSYLPLIFSGACSNASSVAVNNVNSSNIHQLFVVNPYVDVNGNCATPTTSVGGNVVVYDISKLRGIAATAGTGLATVNGTKLSGPKQPFAVIAGTYGVYVSDLNSSSPCSFTPATVGCGTLWFFPANSSVAIEAASAQSTNTGSNPTGLALVTRLGTTGATASGYECPSFGGNLDSVLVFDSGAFGTKAPVPSMTMVNVNGTAMCPVLIPESVPTSPVTAASSALSVAPELASIGAFSPDGDLGQVGGQVLFADGSLV